MVLTAAPPPPQGTGPVSDPGQEGPEDGVQRGKPPPPPLTLPEAAALAAGEEPGEQACPDLTGSAPPSQKARLQLGCSEGLRGQLW